jgi:hypothetical protein
MALKRVDLVVLYCGQGMANLIELYKSSDAVPDALVLCDFGVDGFDKQRDLSKTKPVNYLVDKLKEMKGVAPGGPNIACTVISHQDGDHWSLLPPFVDAVKATSGLNVTMGTIYCGGERWSTRADNAVATFAQLAGIPSPVLEFEPDETAFGDPKQMPAALYSFDNFSLYLIFSNLSELKGATKDDIVKNATSAVVMGVFEGNAFLLPGDSTVLTMNAVTKIVEAYKAGGVGVWPEMRALGVPHHGAVRTFTGDSAYSDFSVGKRFAKTMRGRSINVSAGWKNSHHHPNIDVIWVFRKYTALEWIKHQYVAFHPTDNDWSVSDETTDGIFSTIDTLADPPRIQNWSFSFKKTVIAGVETVVMTPRAFDVQALDAPPADTIPIAPAPDEPR